MTYQIQHRKYARRFRKPLQTGSQTWEFREGIIIRLEDSMGNVGFGEVAPIAGFQVEKLEEAEEWLGQLKGCWDRDQEMVPRDLPCCGFAISSALGWIEGIFEIGKIQEKETAGLLPAGHAALGVQVERKRDGFETFKWKIGVGKLEDELKIAKELAKSGKIRLDANGSLKEGELTEWISMLEASQNLEVLEQPLSPGNWQKAQELADQKNVAHKIALDEEVTTSDQFEKVRDAGFRGKFVVKSALAGWITKERWKDAIHSSALETAIGKETALRLAVDSKECLGFGVGELFEEDGLELHSKTSKIEVGAIGIPEMEKIWARIKNC